MRFRHIPTGIIVQSEKVLPSAVYEHLDKPAKQVEEKPAHKQPKKKEK